MKTSFYFVVWIVIYPLLYLTGNAAIIQNAFIVALLVVWLLSSVINRSMSGIIRYERRLQIISVLENVYTGNVEAFGKRLKRETLMEFITAIYFGATFIFIIITFSTGNSTDWIALAIFGFFGFASISRAYQFNEARINLSNNPLPETCAEIAEKLYRLHYATYYEKRQQCTLEEMKNGEPRNFRAFQIFSLVISIICIALGAIEIIVAIRSFVFGAHVSGAVSAAIMYFLYGTLALNFGIKDTMSSFDVILRKKQPNRAA